MPQFRGVVLAAELACLLVLSSCSGEPNASERKQIIDSLMSRPLVYVAIGASDTVGVGAADPQMESWVALLFSRLPAGTRFFRLGVSGSTAAQALQEQLPAAERASPDLVTIWLAGNDFAAQIRLDDYRRSLEQILKGLSNGGKTRIFIGNLPDMTEVPAYSLESKPPLAARVDEWNSTIAGLAEENGATLVDLYKTSRDAGSPNVGLIASDGFHPSTQGYRVIADAFWDAITADPILGPVVAAQSRAVVLD